MKMRLGFVSNSSSASFIINLKYLTAEQLNKILKNDYKDQDFCEPWGIEVDMQKELLIGHTSMDNYDMHYFLHEKLQISEKFVEWFHD